MSRAYCQVPTVSKMEYELTGKSLLKLGNARLKMVTGISDRSSVFSTVIFSYI